MFDAQINGDYFIGVDIDRYQGVLEHAFFKSKFFNRCRHIYLPGNLKLNIGKTVGYNNKILISNADMKIGSNRNIYKAEVHKSTQS